MAGTGVLAVAGCLGSDTDAPIDVRLEVNSDNDDRVQMVELIASSLEETGYFDVEIEDYEWNDYVARVMDPEYAENGYVPCIGLSGTFNPESFCNALHHSGNHGQCCNLNGISDSELDDMIDDARYGTDVVEDTDPRRERYDEIWEYLAEERYSSITYFDLDAGLMNTDVHGFSMYPFSESIFSYGLYAPHDEQVMWMDEDAHPDDTDLSDLEEGGTLRIGAAENPDSFDPPYSTDTTSTMVQEFVFEQLVRSDVDGNLYPWLAESYELLEVNDVDRTDYEEYMITVDLNEDGLLGHRPRRRLRRVVRRPGRLPRRPRDRPTRVGDRPRQLDSLRCPPERRGRRHLRAEHRGPRRVRRLRRLRGRLHRSRRLRVHPVPDERRAVGRRTTHLPRTNVSA